MVGVFLAVLTRRSKAFTWVLSAGGLYVLLIGLTHWEIRYYFSIMVLHMGLVVFVVFCLLARVQAYNWLSPCASTVTLLVVMLVVWTMAFGQARGDVTRFLARHPTELLRACEYLRSAKVHGARIMARKPHPAYLCRQDWIFFPQVQSLEELCLWVQNHPVDCLFISSIELAVRP